MPKPAWTLGFSINNDGMKSRHSKRNVQISYRRLIWPARRDSNPRPLESESTAISSFATGGYRWSVLYFTLFSRNLQPLISYFPFLFWLYSIRAVKSPPIGGLFTKLEGCFEEGRTYSILTRLLRCGSAPSLEYMFIIRLICAFCVNWLWINCKLFLRVVWRSCELSGLRKIKTFVCNCRTHVLYWQ